MSASQFLVRVGGLMERGGERERGKGRRARAGEETFLEQEKTPQPFITVEIARKKFPLWTDRERPQPRPSRRRPPTFWLL